MKKNLTGFLCLAVLAVILASCTDRPNFMQYEVVFYAPLGSDTNQIGSNIPLLTNYYSNSSEVFIGDYIDVSKSFDVFRDKLYLADKYNRRVSVYPLKGGGDEAKGFTIPPSGEGYSFNTPFQVILNKYGEIFVVASQSNIEAKYDTNFINIDPSYIDTNAIKGSSNYYIYKFSPDGKFVYAIGNNGIHSEPMAYPDRIDTDLFDNLYAFYKEYDKDDTVWLVKRFSPSGELSFEFSTRYISSTNIRNKNVYVGRVGDIYNLKNDERLIIYTDNYGIKNGAAGDSNAGMTGMPENTYHSLDEYSILQNAITKNIFESKRYMDQFLKVTKDDILVLYSYVQKPKYRGIRFRFIDINSQSTNEEIYYAPVLSDNTANFGFFVDNDGNIYSVVVKDNNYFILLRWIKVQSRK
ncbi:MAG: hypothetical protein ABSG94_00705 [Brevinematales bacterium]|jgi:hypothetical protein